MATSILPSPMRLCPMDRCDLSPAKRIAIGPSQHQRPSKCSSVEVVRIESSTSTLSESDGQDHDSLVSLLRSVPQKDCSPSTVLKRFQMYPNLVDVYSSLSSCEQLPAQTAELLEDRSTKRSVYQVIFEVMHHHSIIEEMLIESSFYSRYFDLHSHRLLVLIMAYDLQKERFTLRLPGDDVDQIPGLVVKVAQALWQHRVKLNATLARMRVKQNAQSVTQLIPNPDIRERYENALREPCYARVNSIKVDDIQTEVLSVLCNNNYTLVTTQEEFEQQKRSFRHLHRDLLEFSADCRGTLNCKDLVKDGYMILQDKQSYDFVEKLRDHLESHSHGDVVLTHCNAGVEAVHIASILGDRGTVLAFNVEQRLLPLLNKKTITLGVNNVRFIRDPFSMTSHDDDHLASVKMIVCLPPVISPTCISHPVDFLLQEEDLYLTSILQEVDRVPVTVYGSKTATTNEQMECLQHALTFTQADQIVYATRSNHESENGAVVRRIMENYKGSQESDNYCMLPRFQLKRCTQPKGEEQCYYVALLGAKIERSGPSANEVIKNAIAKGILDGNGISSHPTKLKKKASKTKRVFSRYEGIPMTISAQKKIVKKKDQASPKKVFR